MRRLFQLTATAALVGVMALGVGGCIFSPDEGGEGGDTVTYEKPTSEEALMRNFEKAYENMDFDAYKNCLYDSGETASSYKFKFAQAEIDAGLPDVWTLANDLEAQEKMFNSTASNAPGHEGEYVERIDVLQMDKNGSLVPSQDLEFSSAEDKRTYSVDIEFVLSLPSGSESRLRVTSTQEFYFITIDTDDDGVDEWYIAGQLDPGLSL